MTGSKNIYLKESYPRGETRGDYVNIYISNRCVLREGWGRLVRGERDGEGNKAKRKQIYTLNIIISNPRKHG